MDLLPEIAHWQGWSFPLHYPLVLDPKDTENWGLFQVYLKVVQYVNQEGKCVCGQPLEGACDLHHALISRADFDSLLIHHCYNCLVLHRSCHLRVVRFDCMALLSEIFGYDAIADWYYDVKSQMKSNLRNLERID